MLGFRVSLRLYCQVKAKFHYTDTDTDFFCGETDPHGPNRVSPQKSPCPCPCRARVRVSVVEFSYKGADVQRAGVNVPQNSSTVDPISGVSRQTAVARSVLISTLRPVVQPRPPRADDTAAL